MNILHISSQTYNQRYKRVTLQITTTHPEQIIERYVKDYRHGVSVVNGYGGYSKNPMSLLHTVVSAYEVQDIENKNILPDGFTHFIRNI